jgi:hypothetical protein
MIRAKRALKLEQIHTFINILFFMQECGDLNERKKADSLSFD